MKFENPCSRSNQNYFSYSWCYTGGQTKITGVPSALESINAIPADIGVSFVAGVGGGTQRQKAESPPASLHLFICPGSTLLCIKRVIPKHCSLWLLRPPLSNPPLFSSQHHPSVPPQTVTRSFHDFQSISTDFLSALSPLPSLFHGYPCGVSP